jgi:hypothetical protein
MARLNTNQKRRKRRRRRRERDKRWLARGKKAGVYIVTSMRRMRKLYGEPNIDSCIAQKAFEFFKAGGSDLYVRKALPDEGVFDEEQEG